MRSSRCPSSCFSSLKQLLQQKILTKRQELHDIQSLYANKVVGQMTFNQTVGGMRGIKALFYDQSTVDPNQGVLFRGHSIPQIHKILPKAPCIGSPVNPSDPSILRQPMPEGIFYLLLTGEIPSNEDVESIRQEWEERGNLLSQATLDFINNLDCDLHAMTMLNLAILFEQKHSTFARILANNNQTECLDLWDPMYEDSVDLLAKLPRIVAAIYHRKFDQNSPSASIGGTTPPQGLDWSGRLAWLLGFANNDTLNEGLRAFLTLHSDHEGGEVTTHASHIAGSALADPYLCISNSYAGLAGPLHGLANQEVLKWMLGFIDQYGVSVDSSVIENHVDLTFQAGKLVPGYGHAVLRKTDPRFTHFRDFSASSMSNSPMVQLLLQMTSTIPVKLSTFKKISNPYPNVDAASGTMLYELGLKNYTFYTVLFAMSRTIGCVSNLVWGRAFNLEMEEPRSLTLSSCVRTSDN